MDRRPTALQSHAAANLADNSVHLRQLRAQRKIIDASSHAPESLQLKQVAGAVIQRMNTPMNGPPSQLPHGGTSNAAYPGHNVNIPGPNGSDCANGTLSIVTAGENLTPGAVSKPGTPADLKLYNNLKPNDWYSRAGGLARDANLKQTATKMHAINHRLDPGPTQGTSDNIFMGTAASNNPNHLNLVETPVIDSLGYAGNNAAYEAAMASATHTFETVTHDEALYWPASAGINPAAIDHSRLQNGVVDKTNIAGGGVRIGGAVSSPNDERGQVLVLGPHTPTENYYHGYVDYRITPNYSGIPAYVNSNILEESVDQVFKANVNRGVQLVNFPGWAHHAFPTNFNADVTYYTASYLYKTNDLYYSHSERDNYSTDL